MDTKKVDVMVADASHEIYVDKILDPSEKRPKYVERASQNAHTSMWRQK